MGVGQCMSSSDLMSHANSIHQPTAAAFQVMSVSPLGRDQSRYVPSQWEASLQCNDASHWQGTRLSWSLFGLMSSTCQTNDASYFTSHKWNMSPWWPLLELLSWCPIFKWSLCKSSKDGAPIDEIYGCHIFEWVAETWLNDRVPG